MNQDAVLFAWTVALSVLRDGMLLSVLCLLFGLFLIWLVDACSERRRAQEACMWREINEIVAECDFDEGEEVYV